MPEPNGAEFCLISEWQCVLPLILPDQQSLDGSGTVAELGAIHARL